MRVARSVKLLAIGLMSAGLVTLSACGAGSRTAQKYLVAGLNAGAVKG